MPEPAAATDEAARRRQAAGLLRIMACTCSYGAAQLANGTGPIESAETVAFVAAQLAETADSLRRLVQLSPAQRRVRAVQLAALGASQAEIAARLNVSERAVRGYLNSAVSLATATPTMPSLTAWSGNITKYGSRCGWACGSRRSTGARWAGWRRA